MSPDPNQTAPIGSGLLVLVVGASGVGKDTLIRQLIQAVEFSDLVVVRRAITRPPETSEDHVALTPEDFASTREQGGFAITWSAHELAYGLPIAMDDAIRAGRRVLASVSRTVVAAARSRYVNVHVIEIAASPEVRRVRLASRGRESAESQVTRLERHVDRDENETPDAVVSNDGDLDTAVQAFAASIRFATHHRATPKPTR